MLPGFSFRDIVAVLIKCIEDGAERRLVVSSAYLPYDSEDPRSREMKKLVRYCENENLYLIWGATPMHIIMHGAAPTVMIEGRPLWNSSILLIYKFLIRAMSPSFAVVLG